MKHIFLAYLLSVGLSTSAVLAQSVFIPENGSYKYTLDDVARIFDRSATSYVSLKDSVRRNYVYKLDTRRNEFQIKDWFRHDWYKLQDMFRFDPSAYIQKYAGNDFNHAKRKQYANFRFDKKKFFHYKTVPAMKEWGGLTHPPIKRLTMPLAKYDRNFYAKDYTKTTSQYFSPALQREIDAVSRSELTFKNELIPLADRKAFIKKLALIQKAKSSIYMSSLVFVCDDSTKGLVNSLIRKHREGLEVKVMVDGFIGKILGHRDCLKQMRNAGIEVLETKDFFKHKLKAIYHTKTLVTDLSEAVAGGHNMIDADNTSRSTDFKNRDIDLYVKGPMVTDITKQFAENWRYQSTQDNNFRPLLTLEAQVRRKLKQEADAGLRGARYYNRILTNKSDRMNGVCRFIKQAPYEDRHTIGKAYLKLLNKLSHHLVITDPIKSDTYVGNFLQAPLAEKFDNFDMFNLLHNKVQSIAKAGKRIEYITTNINMAGNENVAMMNERIKDQLEDGDEFLANWSLTKLVLSNSYYGNPHYKNLMKDWMPHSNVRVWTHMSFMHSKIFYFDRVVASIGSYNFQHNATDQAYESTAICMDAKLNRELDTLLVEDMVNSIPLIYSSLR